MASTIKAVRTPEAIKIFFRVTRAALQGYWLGNHSYQVDNNNPQTGNSLPALFFKRVCVWGGRVASVLERFWRVCGQAPRSSRRKSRSSQRAPACSPKVANWRGRLQNPCSMAWNPGSRVQNPVQPVASSPVTACAPRAWLELPQRCVHLRYTGGTPEVRRMYT
jgi:hypothetical protein